MVPSDVEPGDSSPLPSELALSQEAATTVAPQKQHSILESGQPAANFISPICKTGI